MCRKDPPSGPRDGGWHVHSVIKWHLEVSALYPTLPRSWDLTGWVLACLMELEGHGETGKWQRGLVGTELQPHLRATAKGPWGQMVPS